jgi:hypothetical protein
MEIRSEIGRTALLRKPTIVSSAKSASSGQCGCRAPDIRWAQADTEALVINAAVNVTLLCFDDGAFEPRAGHLELPGARQAVADLMQAAGEAGAV